MSWSDLTQKGFILQGMKSFFSLGLSVSAGVQGGISRLH
jgi:hypothetical protein